MAGLTIASPIALLLALIGNITSYITASLLGADKATIELGKFGFNGVLIGAAASVYIKQLPAAIAATVIAACIGAFIYYFLLRNHIEPFAVPFVLAAWGIILLAKHLIP